MAVGGAPQRRGVIATCNYEARKYGIHSAMASATAMRLCKDLIIIRPAMEKYREASAQIHSIFKDYTNLIEPLSLDEAYLDVSNAEQFEGSATLIAKDIRRRVREEIGITLSAGVAPNKFLAKIASDWNKPDGQFVITPDKVERFVSKLAVNKLHGVGKVTAKKMNRLGIHTCDDLRKLGTEKLTEHFGSFGARLFDLSRGIDPRPVKTERIRKSLSVENTYAEDLPTLQHCIDALPDLYQQMTKRLQNLSSGYRIKGQFVKIKFRDFVITTVEMSSTDSNMDNYITLCEQGYARGNKPVRLLGLGVRLNSGEKESSTCSTHQQLDIELN